MIPDSIESAIAKLITKELLSQLVKKLPLLAWKIVNPVAAYFISWVVEAVLKYTVLNVNLFLLDQRIQKEAERLTKAVDAVKAITPETPKEEMDAIDAEIEDAARKLIDFTRSRSTNSL